MSLFVCKYGGSSIGSLARIQAVARQIAQRCDQGHAVVVVLSAMQGETDRLVGMAKRMGIDGGSAAFDALLATGELASCALMSMALTQLGHRSEVFTGREAGLHTDDVHGNATLERVESARLSQALEKGIIPVVTGFQGVSPDGRITTLGRGGSDLTAVALASALHADECLIYTDVPGIYTTDPKFEPKARLLHKISWQAMLVFSQLGAKVLQEQAVAWACQHRVPLRVLSSFFPGPGSQVGEAEEGSLVVGVGVDPAPSVLATWTGKHDAFVVQQAAISALADVETDHREGEVDAFIWSSEDQSIALKALLPTAHFQSVMRVSVVLSDAHTVLPMDKVKKRCLELGIELFFVFKSELRLSFLVPVHQKLLAVQVLHQMCAEGVLDKVCS